MNTNAINYDELEILLKKATNIVDRGKINVVEVNGCKLICYENGDIYRNFRGNKRLALVKNTNNGKNGYNQINCEGKLFYRHRVIAYAFLELNIDDKKAIIDHVDRSKLNNNVINLRVVTKQQNTFNQSKTK